MVSGEMQDHRIIALQAPRYHHLPATTQPSTTQTKGASGTEVLPKQSHHPTLGCPEDAMAGLEVNKAMGSN